MAKNVYFSNYIDKENILIYPSQGDAEIEQYRYKITIPFKNRDIQSGKIAVVIMKNPSKAGKLDQFGKKKSDDTIYNVLDYLFKHKGQFCKVIIINLFGRYGSIFSKISFNSKEDLIGPENNEIIKGIFENAEPDKYIIIAAWGGLVFDKDINQARKVLIKETYQERIKYIFDLANKNKRSLWRVGDLVDNEKFPAHGKYWYDYEELIEYNYL